MFSSIKSIANTIIGYPTVQKTKDPRYSDAKKKLLVLEQDTEKLVGTFSQMLSQMKELSSILLKLCTNISIYLEEFDQEEIMNKVITIESFVRSFDNLTLNFLLPRLNLLIIQPLARFQKEIYRLQGLKQDIKTWRTKYDYNRTYYEYYVQKQYKETEIEKWRNDFEEARDNYTKYNEDFIDSIFKLMEARTEIIEKPSKVFIAVISQYFHQVFTEIQKFRTTFPEAIINDTQNKPSKENEESNPTKQKKSIKEIVFSEEEEEILEN